MSTQNSGPPSDVEGGPLFCWWGCHRHVDGAAPPPPTQVGADELKAAFGGLKDWEFFLGLGPGGPSVRLSGYPRPGRVLPSLQ